MCGIAGFLSHSIAAPEQATATLHAMAAALLHRGPDDQGIWIDMPSHLGLAHRRLSIVDLSPGGHQPMVSSDGRFVIVFNGEIYNHPELREELQALGDHFHSSSDTEVLLQAIAHWGVVATCKRLLGMFAFALWDKETQHLWLARDRLGKKPLYLYRDGNGGIAFASELKALWHFPGFKPTLDGRALAEYFRYSYIPDHVSIFKEVDKVMPGTVLEIALTAPITLHRYWSLFEVVERQSHFPINNLEEAEESLLDLLRDATRRRMLADVPLGAFLSGGIDSGLVTALMQEASLSKVKTFSIGFRDAAYDEAPVAKAVARHLGTQHTELYVTENEAQQIVPLLPQIFDEPFADASQIPTYLLAKLTRDQVTVALTGDGGDESFGGYSRYRNQSGMMGALYHLPRPLRYVMAQAAATVPAGVWEKMVSLIPAQQRPRFIASKVSKLARAMQMDNPAERGKAFLSFWSPQEILRDPALATLTDPYAFPSCLLDEPSEAMQFWETLHYLSGDLLVKTDRATMAASLEARCPLLDHRVVELAWRLPASMKASPIASKRILRNLLFRYVPRQIVDLPKQGFSVPIGKWLSSALRPWVESMFSYGRAHTYELINWTVIDQTWRDHLAGRPGHAEKLWIVLMFCAWHQHWMNPAYGQTGKKP
ncbi:MAG: asparagine synthase (glutamine-hydrolyzing) [Gallionellaceae bacterium]|nr:asparagine synthase (glutamine-hydrolyzing) [Gallionellaceae bacterium]